MITTTEQMFLDHLTALGVPIFTSKTGGKEFQHPANWPTMTADDNVDRIARRRPGDALMALMGGKVATVDVDPRNGGDVDRMRTQLVGLNVKIFAEVATPGGGAHSYVEGHSLLASCHQLEGWPGVDIQSFGTLLFLPGTQRPKYGGKGYTIVFDNLEALADGGDPDGAEALADWVAGRRGRGVDFAPSPPWSGEVPDARQAAYLAAILRRLSAELGAMGKESGRNTAVYNAGLACGNYIAGAGLDEDQTVDCLLEASTRNGLVHDDGPATVQASIRSGIKNGKATPRAVPDPDSQVTETSAGELVGAVTGEVLTEEPTRASWAPVDLRPYLDGTYRPPVPTLMPRTDDVCLLYPTLTHSFHGESESGKSMLAQFECSRQIMAGEDVLFVDFESDEASVTERLLMFGATTTAILDHFFYIKPDVDPSKSVVESAAWGETLSRSYTLAIIDGVTDSMGTFGYSTKDNDDITAWMLVMPKRIARSTGAAVAVIDHVTKDGDTRGRFAIGGQAKLSGLTGAAFTVEVDEALGRGLRGIIVVRVAKDRPGYIRGHSGPRRSVDGTQEVARIVVDSTGPLTVVTVNPGRGIGGEPVGPFRPTALMEKVSMALETATQPLTTNGINALVSGKEQAVTLAIKQLILEGFADRRDGANRSHLHLSIKPYRQVDDPRSDQYRGRETPEVLGGVSGVSRPYTGRRETPPEVSPGDTRETPGDTEGTTPRSLFAVTSGRCPTCKAHIEQQGHRADCPDRGTAPGQPPATCKGSGCGADIYDPEARAVGLCFTCREKERHSA